jgi:hypothetical protein
MAKQFRYSPANPIRMVPIVTNDVRYNTVPFDQDLGKAYIQKYQTNDTTKIQVLSDWVPTLKVYNALTGAHIPGLDIVGAPLNTTILSTVYTFLCYEFLLDFSVFGVGSYYIQITYTDDAATLQTYKSDYISVAVKWANTLLYEYNNSENILSILFSTGIVFNVRCEGRLRLFEPKFNAVIFTDQESNATKLNSVPYQQFKLYLGDAPGIPDWFANIFNFVFSCDTILIDGVPYQNIEGSKWNITRPDPQNKRSPTLAVYDIDVMPVDNAFLERLKTGTTTVNGYTPFEVCLPYLNTGMDFAIPAKFFKYWRLDSVSIILNGAAFTLNLGITPGGNEIVKTAFPNSKTVAFRYLFTNAQTIYVSGLTGVAGVNADIFFECKNLNAKPVNSPNTNPVSGGLLPGMEFTYSEVNAGDFANNFDIVTGLGKAGGLYPTCVIMDGRNGTTATGGKYKVGWLSGDATFGTPNAPVGSNNINITNVNQLPPHSFTFQRPRMDVVGGQYQPNAAKNGGNIGLWTGDDAQTNVLGTSADIPFLPGSIVSIWIKCLA